MTPSRSALEQGFAHEEAGRQAEAFDAFRSAVELDPTHGRAWRQMGNLLRRAGRLAEAANCFEHAIAHGDDPALNAFFLSAVGVGELVPAAPTQFVGALYDQYAGRFEGHLTRELGYRGPERLAALVAGPTATRFESGLDLGCGTGLGGRAFRAMAGRLAGVDLSAQMIARAASTGVYDELATADLITHLRETPRRHDLVVACDVLIYFGDLAPVLQGVRRVLLPGGRFAFTAEASGAAAGYDLLPSLRYAHSEASIRALAATLGLAVRGLATGPLRTEDGVPIEGLFVDLQRPPG